MGLGATIKVGLDSSAVKRGLATIKSSFHSLGEKLKGIGRFAKKAFNLPTVIAGLAFVKAGYDVAQLGGELEDMAVQTGVSVDKLVLLQHALRNAGVPINDTSKMLSTLAANLSEAKTGKGGAFDALWDLGLLASDLPKNLDEAFFAIMQRIRDLGPAAQGLEESISGLFGAKMGFGLLRFAKDFDAQMERTLKTSEGSRKFWDKYASELDDAADAMERVGDSFRQTMARAMVLLPWEKIADAVDNFDVHKMFDGIGNFFKNFKVSMEVFMEWVMNKGRELGATIGEGLKESLKGGLRELMPGDGIFMKMMDKIHGVGSASIPPTVSMGRATPGGDTSSMTKLQETTNKILGRIERREGASWA